jgi:hypothetical protein
MPISFPLYGIYQRTHGRRVYAGVVAGGTWQPAFVGKGLAFARIVDLEDSSALWPADAKYLVFHKDIRAEMSRMYSAAASIPELRAHLYPQEKMEIFWTFELGARPLELPAWLNDRFPRVYEDPFIEVYALDPPP